MFTALKVPRHDPPVLVNSDRNWIVLNVKQRVQEQLLPGLIVEIFIGKTALRWGYGNAGMAAKQHAAERGILVEPSFALGPMETRDLDQDGLSQDMQDGCSQQCDFPSMKTLTNGSLYVHLFYFEKVQICRTQSGVVFIRLDERHAG